MILLSSLFVLISGGQPLQQPAERVAGLCGDIKDEGICGADGGSLHTHWHSEPTGSEFLASFNKFSKLVLEEEKDRLLDTSVEKVKDCYGISEATPSHSWRVIQRGSY